jgi:hypothetical protein
MNKKDICVIIPIYKEILNDFEIQSVNQCIKVLSEYSLCFVCPQGLNIDFYRDNFSGINNFTFFDKIYFQSLKGYNRLMLYPNFYKTFNHFKYMLIYQTDCYVFRDELLKWANKGYDYIGGIWFENYIGNPYLGAKLWQAGNGGLSLRKIESISRMLSTKKPIKKFTELFIETEKLRNIGRISFLKGLFLLPFKVFGYNNNVNYLSKNYQFNEDGFIIETSLKLKFLTIPEVKDAIGFSWDCHPKFLYEVFGQLPFACHAWYRNDSCYEGNKEFWSNYIKIK